MNDLHDLFEDAVADVEPADRLDAIRCRTSSPAQAARPWFRAAALTVVGTAATVTLVAALGSGPQPTGPAEHGGHEDHDDATEVPGGLYALLPTYYVGDTPAGPRLFREFVPAQTDDPLQAAVERIQHAPEDPDYLSVWEPGRLTGAKVVDGVIEVGVADGQLLRVGELALQQVVYTVQATVGEPLPVRFVWSNGHELPTRAARAIDVLSPVNISDPAERTAYTGSMITRGRAATTGDEVHWELADETGGIVRRGGAPLVDGTGLRAWETTVDLGGLPGGTYVFTVRTDGSAYGFRSTDTRTISVR